MSETAGMITLTIDGKEIETSPGTLLITAAQNAGIFIPRFCWHERLKPVGMCRMCLVEVEGQRGLVPSCTTPATDGMVVHFKQDNVEKVHDGILELLLVNHPLDCPVCDRGGECPLQDQTLAFGPGESRFVEEKRHWAKPIPVSDLVLLDRERCIQCGRCTRFADEIAGDPLITFAERGNDTEVATFPGEPFSSYFSGNTVQICPVGALTAKQYRFKARPWDLDTVETSCVTCSVQCRGALESTTNRIVRFLGVDSDPVNHGWLCDKGRYGIEWPHREDRIREPLVRRDGELRPASWPEALDAAAGRLSEVLELHGPGAIALLGGGRLTNEGAYAWARLAKGVLRTDHVDAQLGDGLPAEVVLGLPRATIDDCDSARAVVLLAPDLEEELPVLYLRLRRAAVERGVPLIEVAARDTGLTRHVAAVLRHAPGEQVGLAGKLARALRGETTGDAAVDAVGGVVEGRAGDVVVVLGRPSLAEPVAATVAAAAALRGVPGVRFLSALRRGNVHGALDGGLAPGFLPGRVTLDAGRELFTAAWGGVPDATGLDTEGVLRAATSGKVRAILIVGADPMSDFPDRALVREALDAVPLMIAADCYATGSNRRAEVILPVTLWGEEDGTVTNLEGRVQRVAAKVSPDGTPLADWRIAGELASRLGVDFGFEEIEDVTDELARIAPAFRGADTALLVRARDGVVLPVDPNEITLLDREPPPAVTLSWEPIRPGQVGGAVRDVRLVGHADDLDAEAVPTPAGPDLFRWKAAVAAPDVPARDAYALRLVAGRRLYDAGRTACSSPLLAGLAPGSVLLVNPVDRDRIGVVDGETVRVTSARTTVTLPLRADAGTPTGTAFLAVAQDGPGPNDLVDLALAVTDLRVETVR